MPSKTNICKQKTRLIRTTFPIQLFGHEQCVFWTCILGDIHHNCVWKFGTREANGRINEGKLLLGRKSISSGEKLIRETRLEVFVRVFTLRRKEDGRHRKQPQETYFSRDENLVLGLNCKTVTHQNNLKQQFTRQCFQLASIQDTNNTLNSVHLRNVFVSNKQEVKISVSFFSGSTWVNLLLATSWSACKGEYCESVTINEICHSWVRVRVSFESFEHNSEP